MTTYTRLPRTYCLRESGERVPIGDESYFELLLGYEVCLFL